jgi:DNA-binding transcriptional ArsR family regulator
MKSQRASAAAFKMRQGKLRKNSEEVAALLKQLSHPQRLLILCSLFEGEKSVGEIEQACGASQSAVSQFLKGMRLEGFVESRREGKQVYYKILDPKILDLIQSLYHIFCRN